MTSGPISHEDAGTRLTPMTAPLDAAARWERAQALLHEVISRPAGDRAAYLDAACSDHALRHEVEQLVAAHERPGLLDDLSASLITPLRHARGRPPDAPPPVLDRYTIVGELGRGGMGVVYRARDARLGREVALKFLSPHLVADQTAKRRFMIEARAAAALEHPNICTIHEVGETADGQLYIVMAYYEGEGLDAMIERGPVPVHLALRVAGDIARGLARAHERGIVHRDIKPANVMLTGDGVVKILDFGVAKLSDAAQSHTGERIGTAAYMSPEQTAGEPIDHRSDLWSLGVVLFEMLAGSRPFEGSNERSLIAAILHSDPTSIRAVCPDAPAEVDAVLARLLAKQADSRHASAHELLRDLDRIEAVVRAHPADAGAGTRAAADPARRHHALADTPLTRSGERRQVTVVTTIIDNYGDLVEHLVPEALSRLEHALRDAAVDAAARYGGIVNQFSADRITMLFGVPVTHEDDLLRAARTVQTLHRLARELHLTHAGPAGTALRLRSGVDTGLVVAQRLRSGDQRFRIAGAPAEGSRRLAEHAPPDTILMTPECQRLGPAMIRADTAHSLVLVDGGALVTPLSLADDLGAEASGFEPRRSLTPYAGRTRELASALDQFAAAMAGDGRLMAVIGEAGTGKSRLLLELRRHARDTGASVVLGRCDAFGRSTPYLPFIQVLRGVLGLSAREDLRHRHDEIVARILEVDRSLADFLPLYLSLLAIPSLAHPVPRHLQGEHFQAGLLDALTAMFTMHAMRARSLLALEDWHWADEASRELLRQLAHLAPAYPLFVAVTSRPEVSVRWDTTEHQMLLHLGPIGRAATSEIARAVLGPERATEPLVDQLYERTGGNPFFLEEMCYALREEAAVGTRGAAQLPDTVQAVIRSRIDRLEPQARDVLRVASVIGRDFSRGLIERMTDAAVDIAQALERLKDSGLVLQTSVVPEPAYRFRHVLTQEVAYDTLLEHQRRALHAAAGRAIEATHAGRLEEHLDRLAHHFSGAGEWPTAIRYGIAAANRATELGQFPDASSIVDRLQQWLPHLAENGERRALLVDVLLLQERLCETLGLRARQLRLIDELIALLAPEQTSAKLAEAYQRQGDVYTLLRRFDAADRALGTALRISRERGDQTGERNALRSMGLLRWHEGRSSEALEAVQGALDIDRIRGNELGEAGDLANLGIILRSLGRHDEALRLLEDALQRPVLANDPIKRSYTLQNLAGTLRDLGETEQALHYLEHAAQDAEKHRLPVQSSFHLTAIAHMLLQDGRIDDSLRHYRRAVELSRRSRHAVGLAQSLRILGEVLLGLGQHTEALPHLREAAELFAQLEDRATEASMWSGVATASEQLGDHGEAHPAWQRARELYQRERDNRGELVAAEGAARALRRQGPTIPAVAAYEEALSLAMRIGDTAREIALRNTLGIMQWESGAFEAALAQYETALRLAREGGADGSIGLLLASVGATLARLQRHEEARTVLEEACRVTVSLGEVRNAAYAQTVLGDTYAALGRRADARRCFEDSLGRRREIGDDAGVQRMSERIAGLAGTTGAPATNQSSSE